MSLGASLSPVGGRFKIPTAVPQLIRGYDFERSAFDRAAPR